MVSISVVSISMWVVSVVSIGISLSISGSLAIWVSIVSVVGKTISITMVGKTISIVTIESISISTGVSIGRPLAIVISMVAIWVSIVSMVGKTISITMVSIA